MRPTHPGELADEVRAAQTMLQDIKDDPKSSEAEVKQATTLLRLEPEEFANRIQQRTRSQA